MKRLLAIGEIMIEFSGTPDGAWRLGFAGDTLNTAWYARALLDPAGWEVAYFTRLGQDRYSERMIAFLEANGIGAEHIGRDPTRRPGLYLIELEDGERSFTYWRETSAARLLADDETALARAIAVADAVYFSGVTLAILAPDRRAALTRLAAEARARGALVAFDPNIRPQLWESAEAMQAAIMRAAAAASLVLPSFDDEAAAFGDAAPEATAARYGAAGCGEVVVKDGRRPALVWDQGAVGAVPAPPVARLVDSTGAGDSFNGAYLAARLARRTPQEAAGLGHRVAGQVIGRHGAIIPQAEVAAAAAGRV